jgi:hypothetical protein
VDCTVCGDLTLRFNKREGGFVYTRDYQLHKKGSAPQSSYLPSDINFKKSFIIYCNLKWFSPLKHMKFHTKCLTRAIINYLH